MTDLRITVAVLTYNSARVVQSCLAAVFNQTRPSDEVIVVDNASTDDTVAIVEATYPDVKLVRCGQNTGCSGGRNRQIGSATHRYVMIVDDDAFLERRCLERIAKAMAALSDGAIWSPRICYDQNRNLVQYDGGDIHFIGETVAINAERALRGPPGGEANLEGSHQLVAEAPEAAEPLPTDPFVTTIQGGVAYLVDKEAVLALGGYDESFFFGRADSELSFRMTLSGRKIYIVPRAIVYHRMTPRGLKYVRNQVRNRWMLILINYSWRTILVLMPAFIVYEVLLMVFLTLKGHLPDYLRGNREVLANLAPIMRKRHQMQSVKRRRDRDVLSGRAFNMRADVAGGRPIRLAYWLVNRFFKVYWICVRRLAA